jgi:Uma2 family endonuclease
MIALQKAAAYIELEDYLVLEAASRYRHEYLDGVIYAVQGESVRGLAGGSAAHADLIRNIGFALHARLRGSPCGVKMSEMRLRIDAVDAVFYPDVLVHCQPLARPADITELTEARVVVEVLSPTTQTFDRGAKRAAYQRLPGLRQVVLVSSTEPAAWSMQRDDDAAEWSALQPWPAGTPLAVPSLALDLPWDEVYGGVGLG